MMRVTLRFSSVVTQVGINPSDKPLSGSCAISGTGMNGAVAGLNHLVHPGVAAGGGTVTGPGGAWTPGSPGGICAQQGVARSTTAAAEATLSAFIAATARRSAA